MKEVTATKPLEMSIFGTVELGSLITALAVQPQENIVYFDFCGLSPDTLNSYRGFYDHLAIAWTDDRPPTVADMLRVLRAAVGCTFTGYKGGEYRMTDVTPVWVANYGDAGSTAIVGVDDIGSVTIIRTARVEV